MARDATVSPTEADPLWAASSDQRDGDAETPLLLDSGDRALVGETPKDTFDGAEDFNHLPSWRRPSVYWLVGPFFLYTLAFGGMIVPKLNLIIDLICREYFDDQASSNPGVAFPSIILGGDNRQCQISPVQKAATRLTLVMNLMVGGFSAIVAPRMGYLSDRYGRCKWLAISSLGGIAAEIITIFAAKFPDVVNYRWLIVGAVLDGMGGSFTAGNILGHSYVSDCTPPSRRGVAIGYIHACLFSGLALGPVTSAYFVEATGSLVSVFYVVLGCHVFFVLFTVFAMPESVSQRRQLLSREKHAKDLEDRAVIGDGSWLSSLRTHGNPFGPLRILYTRGPGNTTKFRRNIIALALVDMVLLGAAMGAGTVIILYSEFIFGWTNLETSKFVSATSTVRAFVLLCVLPVVNYLFRTRPAARRRLEGPVVEKNRGADTVDLWIIRSALVSDVLGSMGYLLARSGPVFVASGIVTAFGGLGSATIQAAATKHVPPERVGQLLGAIGLLHALARVLAPLAFSGVYHATLDTFPKGVFILLAGLFSLSLTASFFVKPHVYITDEDGYASESESERPRSSIEDESLLRR